MIFLPQGFRYAKTLFQVYITLFIYFWLQEGSIPSHNAHSLLRINPLRGGMPNTLGSCHPPLKTSTMIILRHFCSK